MLQELGPAVDRPLVDFPEGHVQQGCVTAEPPVMGRDQATIVGDDTLKTLFSMAASPFADVQKEAARALAQVSDNAFNQKRLVQEKSEGCGKSALLMVLSKLLTSKDEEVTRCATLLLSNICRQVCVRGDVIRTILCPMFTLLNEHECGFGLMGRGIRRELARCVALLCETHAHVISQNQKCAAYCDVLKGSVADRCGDTDLEKSVHFALSKMM